MVRKGSPVRVRQRASHESGLRRSGWVHFGSSNDASVRPTVRAMSWSGKPTSDSDAFSDGDRVVLAQVGAAANRAAGCRIDPASGGGPGAATALVSRWSRGWRSQCVRPQPRADRSCTRHRLGQDAVVDVDASVPESFLSDRSSSRDAPNRWSRTTGDVPHQRRLSDRGRTQTSYATRHAVGVQARAQCPAPRPASTKLLVSPVDETFADAGVLLAQSRRRHQSLVVVLPRPWIHRLGRRHRQDDRWLGARGASLRTSVFGIRQRATGKAPQRRSPRQ